MKLLPTLLLATTTLASPLTTRDGDATKQFHLKTSSQTNAAHTNLYVSAYHTGAGLNDAVLTKDAGSAASAVLNGTKTQFKLGGLDWGFQMPGDTNYAGKYLPYLGFCSSLEWVMLMMMMMTSMGTGAHQRRSRNGWIRNQRRPSPVVGEPRVRGVVG